MKTCSTLLVVASLVACSSAVPPAETTATPEQLSDEETDLDLDTGLDTTRDVDDALITRLVEHELATAQAVPAVDVKVRTVDGIVELRGSVPYLLAGERAVLVAQGVKGVRAVVDRLHVAIPNREDGDIRLDVKLALLEDPATEAQEIAVGVRNQVVRLRGTVQSWQEKRLASLVAKRVRGVRHVDDQIEVIPRRRRGRSEILADVRQALRWDTLVDDAMILVTVEGSTVHLTGLVGSASERRRAVADAWVTGVRKVEAEDLEVRWYVQRTRLRRGKYGPRSDGEILAALTDAAELAPRVKAAALDVTVEDGVVTLHGTAPNLLARQAAEQLARNVIGVRAVENHIRVRHDRRASDRVLARRVEDALARSALVSGDRIEVLVADRKVFLTGTVSTPMEAVDAGDIARSVAGITEVEVRLDVLDSGSPPYLFDPYWYPYAPYAYDPRPLARALAPKSDTALRRDVQRELHWSPFVDAEQVQVSVLHGIVTLIGSVDTMRERQAAEHNAYQAGAHLVRNRLEIAPR